MDWRALLLPREKPVAVGLIGLGSFGLSFLRQSLHVPGMSVVALCDADGEGGLAAAEAAGLPRPTICETATAAQRILEQGKLPLLVDGTELPFAMLDAVVEASGAPRGRRAPRGGSLAEWLSPGPSQQGNRLHGRTGTGGHSPRQRAGVLNGRR